jgi:hypothetical protein
MFSVIPGPMSCKKSALFCTTVFNIIKSSMININPNYFSVNIFFYFPYNTGKRDEDSIFSSEFDEKVENFFKPPGD